MQMDEMTHAIAKYPNKTGLVIKMANGSIITGIIDTMYEDDNLYEDSEHFDEYYSTVICLTEDYMLPTGELKKTGELTEINYHMPIKQIGLFDGTVIWSANQKE